MTLTDRSAWLALFAAFYHSPAPRSAYPGELADIPRAADAAYQAHRALKALRDLNQLPGYTLDDEVRREIEAVLGETERPQRCLRCLESWCPGCEVGA